MNTQFAENVCSFTRQISEEMLKEFDGKVVGSDEMNIQLLMTFYFGTYVPGDPVKKKKKEKKPRPLTGYTYFGKQNKDKLNAEIEAMDEKPKYIEYLASKWGDLDKDEKKEWTIKAKEAFEAEQK